jgi:nicotinamidase-related amidase
VSGGYGDAKPVAASLASGGSTGRTALIVTDMLNRYEHDDADRLASSVAAMLRAVVQSLERAQAEDVPVVYVNDNHGDWAAGRRELCEWALAGPHARLVQPVLPPEDAAFIVKAHHSVFFETQLDYMLRREGIERLVLVGQVTEQCILYSALDAYVRHYQVVVPRDAVAHIHAELAEAALKMMEINMRAEITSVRDCQLT